MRRGVGAIALAALRCQNAAPSIFHSRPRFAPRYSTDASPGEEAKSDRLLLVTTCGKCNAPIRKTFSRIAYEKGVVLIKCDGKSAEEVERFFLFHFWLQGCGVRHLIADHIGWFSHVQGHDLEDYYPGKVKRGKLEDHIHLEAASPSTEGKD